MLTKPDDKKIIDEYILSTIIESLKNINFKKFKGIMIHWPWDLNKSNCHIINTTFKKIKKYKLSNEVGVSIYSNYLKEDYLDLIDLEFIQCPFNLVDQSSKYLIINSKNPINEINFNLNDLKSRSKDCLFAKIDNPDDELMFAILLKNFSDRQITIEKKLIDFIIKHIDRSYGKIYEFIYKIDEISLKKKKSIDFRTIKEALKV